MDFIIRTATMKLNKRHLIVIAIVLSSVLCMAVFILEISLKVNSASTGMAHGYLQSIGRAIAYSLEESNFFPKDGSPDGKTYQEGQTNQWYAVFDSDLLSKSGRIINKDIPNAYFDSSIWIVVKNIPDDPPQNLIVLATRNVDPSSLRTKLTYEDMQKHIRFREENDDLEILRKYAVLFFADGMCTSVPVVSPVSRGANRTTYKFIYRNRPFDLTTNLVNGLQVKYLTPEGEIIPVND